MPGTSTLPMINQQDPIKKKNGEITVREIRDRFVKGIADLIRKGIRDRIGIRDHIANGTGDRMETGIRDLEIRRRDHTKNVKADRIKKENAVQTARRRPEEATVNSHDFSSTRAKQMGFSQSA